MVGPASSRTGKVLSLEFNPGGALRHVVLPCRMTVGSSDLTVELGRLRLGLIQAPLRRLVEALAGGALVEVLRDHAPPPTPWRSFIPAPGRLLRACRHSLNG